jgi:hypothetical protein
MDWGGLVAASPEAFAEATSVMQNGCHTALVVAVPKGASAAVQGQPGHMLVGGRVECITFPCIIEFVDRGNADVVAHSAKATDRAAYANTFALPFFEGDTPVSESTLMPVKFDCIYAFKPIKNSDGNAMLTTFNKWLPTSAYATLGLKSYSQIQNYVGVSNKKQPKMHTKLVAVFGAAELAMRKKVASDAGAKRGAARLADPRGSNQELIGESEHAEVAARLAVIQVAKEVWKARAPFYDARPDERYVQIPELPKTDGEIEEEDLLVLLRANPQLLENQPLMCAVALNKCGQAIAGGDAPDPPFTSPLKPKPTVAMAVEPVPELASVEEVEEEEVEQPAEAEPSPEPPVQEEAAPAEQAEMEVVDLEEESPALRVTRVTRCADSDEVPRRVKLKLTPPAPADPPQADPPIVCNKCKSGDDEEGNEIVLCDGKECDGAFHQQCLKPNLKKVPRGTWMCDDCVTSGNEPSSEFASPAPASSRTGRGPGGERLRYNISGANSADSVKRGSALAKEMGANPAGATVPTPPTSPVSEQLSAAQAQR